VGYKELTMSEKNGNVVRTIFWTLILASFGWTTAVLAINAQISTAVASEAKADLIREQDIRSREDAEIKKEMIRCNEMQRARDEKLMTAMSTIQAKMGIKDQ